MMQKLFTSGRCKERNNDSKCYSTKIQPEKDFVSNEAVNANIS